MKAKTETRKLKLEASTFNFKDESGITFSHSKINQFKPFPRGSAVIGNHFGDTGKGKKVDALASYYKALGFKVLSIRGQGSGNAGHTVVVDGKKMDFHYLTSAGLSADIMLLGPGMLIDPLKVLEESQQLPLDKRSIIMIAERATIITDLDRGMDSWCEQQRSSSGQKTIGTTGSGVGPGAGNRGYRVHVTFGDALQCKNSKELMELLLKNPLYPEEVKALMTEDKANKIWEAIKILHVVDSGEIITRCRIEGDWAVLLEVSQAIGLDPLFGNGAHFVTSTPCTDIGGAMGAGLTMYDFPDGSTIVAKAYSSKVGGGDLITKFTDEEHYLHEFINTIVPEKGVTTGRERDLGWFDALATRHAIELTGADVSVNCMDVIAAFSEVTDTIKVCFAYQNKYDGKVTYRWPYNLYDYNPLYATMKLSGNKDKDIRNYILFIEELIGKKITDYGIGPAREDFKKRKEAF